MIELNLKAIPMADDIDLAELAQRIEGYSGADIKGLSEAVTDAPYQRQIETGQEQVVMPADIDQALQRVRPSVDGKQLERYERYREGKGGSK